MSKTVAVLMGGWSVERDVSMVSGRAVAKALRESGYEVREIVVERDLSALLEALTPPPTVIFNALHGKGGEDGRIQGVLDFLNVPYTHSSLLSSAVAMDKTLTKQVLKAAGIPCPAGHLVEAEKAEAADLLERPYVVKPNDEGSSVGVRIVRHGDHRRSIAADASAPEPVNARILVEQYIAGRELTVGVMSAPGERATAMAVTEIIPEAGGFYDYQSKYARDGSRHEIPAAIPTLVEEEIKRLAVLAHETLRCSGVSRSDFRYDDSLPGVGGLYFLEINTQPGMTPTSLIPEQAAHLGMSFNDLVSWMVETATCHA